MGLLACSSAPSLPAEFRRARDAAVMDAATADADVPRDVQGENIGDVTSARDVQPEASADVIDVPDVIDVVDVVDVPPDREFADTGPTSCPTGFADCDSLAANGCEANLTTNSDNCGRCGTACLGLNGVSRCVASSCATTCNSGFADCDRVGANGCEVDLATDAKNCGACGTLCGSTGGVAGCAARACTITCASGVGNCDGLVGNGCETNLATTAAHCGACGRACALPNATATCAGMACGVAACAAGFGDCDGAAANGCETPLAANRNHCGACGRVCASGVCTAGSCAPVPTCPAGMALIPSGTFSMGANDLVGANPVHSVFLTAFCMDETEVTVAGYRACVTATGCTAPNSTSNCNWGVSGRDGYPVNCVDWNQATAYCRWADKALPTEAQWEYAARGADGRAFPWGNEAPTTTLLCWSRYPTPGTGCATLSAPSGDSPFGLSDMAGGVWEWVADWNGPYPADTGMFAAPVNPTGAVSGTARVFRGGSWTDSVAEYVRASSRQSATAGTRAFGGGLRCVRSR